MADYDIAVIGAGSAGLSVAYGAARLGLRTALIERDRMGGDCLNVGCVPSKALLAAAHAARDARLAVRFGVRLAAPEIDWAGVRAHVAAAIAAIAPVDSAERYRGLGATVLHGAARFIAPDALAVDERRLTARRIVVATGSRPLVPPIPGLDALPYLTNETLFDLPAPPAHLLILGGGAIGLEMAQAHACLGCRVTVIEAGRVAAREEPELVDLLRGSLQADGVTFIENADVTAAAPGPVLTLADGRQVAGSHLLVAVGRVPTTDGLDLPAGQVAFGPRAFTHAAGYHASIIIRRAAFRLPARLDYRALPRVIYTAPELAQVGLTAAEAPDATVLRFALAENDRAVAEADTAGMIKLVVAGGRVVGAGILAPHAGEMIGLCGLAIARKLGSGTLAQLILPYPTRAEAVKRAAGSGLSERLFAPRTRRLVRLLARG